MTALADTVLPNDDADDARQPDLRCPICDYSLRGLAEPRCPECGYGFGSWDELRRRVAETHPFLYEHHPRHGFWALWRTWRAGLNTWRFWTSVRPEHRIRVRRLIAYWMWCAALLLAPAAAMYAQVTMEMHFDAQRNRGPYRTYLLSRGNTDSFVRRMGSVDAAVEWIYPRPTSVHFYWVALQHGPGTRMLVPVALTALAWPFACVPAMYLFALTLRRARVRPAQVFRCAVYSWDVVALGALVLAVATAWTMLKPRTAVARGWSRPSFEWHEMIIEWLTPVTWVIAAVVTLRLGVAFGRYLRLRHAMLTAVLIQVVLGLLCAKLIYLMWGF